MHPYMQNVESVPVFAALAVLTTSLAQYSYSRSVELSSELLAWAFLPFIVFVRNNDGTLSPSRLFAKSCGESLTLWLLAICIATTSFFKAEVGVIASLVSYFRKYACLVINGIAACNATIFDYPRLPVRDSVESMAQYEYTINAIRGGSCCSSCYHLNIRLGYKDACCFCNSRSVTTPGVCDALANSHASTVAFLRRKYRTAVITSCYRDNRRDLATVSFIWRDV